MAAKMPELNYTCEICGADGLNDDEMRTHILMCHLKGAATCPFCDLEDVTPEEMLAHVNSAHLDYLTPEQELMTFIDDDEDETGVRRSQMSNWSMPSKPHKGLANNINNNNSFCAPKFVEKEGASGWSPRKSQLALNLSCSSSSSLKTPSSIKCPMCPYSNENTSQLEEHINRQHFDLTSPSFSIESPSGSYCCPICAQTFLNTSDLELHVNIEHKDILSPAKADSELPVEKPIENCPICCMSNFKTVEELGAHIEDHFNQKVTSPLSPDVSCDRLLAREMDKRDKEMRKIREQHEFELLRAQYGMDNEGNFKEQSLTNMQRAVYSGELSVADYYERQVELRAAESTGIDDGSSCTRDIVPMVYSVSSSGSNVVRTLLCTTVDHYAATYGDKGWGCGYRNTQMMISSLLQHTGFNERVYRVWSVEGGAWAVAPARTAMPSISRLQRHIEWAWRQGFDVQGCDQLGGKLTNTRKWIGATEVVTVLSSLRIRCQLVDFHRPTGPSGSHPELFSWVRQYFEAYDDFKPPLYLQHQGHSRTIVGVEVLRDDTVILLVLDPSHTPTQMAQLLATDTAHNAMRLVRKSLAAMKARQYQIVAVCGVMDTEAEYQQSKVFRSMRVPQER